MKYYIRNNEITINKNNYIGEGIETKVYKNGKYVLKLYKNISYLNNEFVYKLSRINTKRIAMPIDFIYDKNNNIIGYSSLYIKKNIKNINSMKTNKLLNNIKYLNYDFQKLNTYHIASCDCHIGNLIYDEYGNVYIIDTGNFYESLFGRELQTNNNSLSYITEELLLSNINDFTNYSVLKSYIKDELFDTDPLYYIKSEVCNYHTISDYQHSLIKRLNRY